MVTISLLIVNGLLQNWCLITASGDDETQVKLALLQLGSLLHKKGVESLPYIYEEYQVHLSLHSLTTYACTAKYMYSNICSLYHNLTSVFVFCCIGNRQPWRCLYEGTDADSVTHCWHSPRRWHIQLLFVDWEPSCLLYSFFCQGNGPLVCVPLRFQFAVL